jgi:hypothetical protein
VILSGAGTHVALAALAGGIAVTWGHARDPPAATTGLGLSAHTALTLALSLALASLTLSLTFTLSLTLSLALALAITLALAGETGTAQPGPGAFEGALALRKSLLAPSVTQTGFLPVGCRLKGAGGGIEVTGLNR